MTAETKRVEVTLETHLDSVGLAEAICWRIADAAGFGEDDCVKISMSVREGVINAIQYGNGGQGRKKVHLTFELTPERMVVRVLDQGPGFSLADVPDCRDQENLLKTSGRGIFLMRAFMDEFEVHRGRQGGAEVVMAKRFPAPRAAGPGNPRRKDP